MSVQSMTDREMVNILLDEHKLAASSLTNLVLESTSQSLRNDATNMLTRVFQHQKQLYDFMSQKGWYQVQQASQQDMNRARQELSNVNLA